MTRELWINWHSWFISGAILLGAILFALGAHFVFFALVDRFSRRKGAHNELALSRRAKKPARIIFPLLALVLALPLAPVPDNLKGTFQHILGLCVIVAIGWAIIILTELAADIVFERYAVNSPDNLTARRIRTQTQVLQRIIVLIASITTVAIMLMTFPAVRHIGVSLLASAGLAGLIVGMAARSTLSNLIAGIQVALTQPIRIDDVVVLEGEWGWIEEIGTTYVVVRIWDLRRLIVPLSYFIEKPFQNWTRSTADILGTVIIYVDYAAPIEELRRELFRILNMTELWDRKVWALQVTDTTEKTMQVRALMSAPNGPAAFDLRCLVREKLIQYLNDNHPFSLPALRQREESMAGHP